jgi:hypothetical protein
MVLIGLAACGQAGEGLGEIETYPNAPWSMDGASSFLFKPGAVNDGSAGDGALVISTASLACGDLGAEIEPSGLAQRGSGLFFHLSYSAKRAADSALPAWNGLFITGGGTDRDDRTSRSLSVSGWTKNGVYAIAGTGGGEAWVRVDQGRDGTFRGEFASEWWTGSFDAVMCSASGSSEDSPADTGSAD